MTDGEPDRKVSTVSPVYGIIFDLMGTLATFDGTRESLVAAWRQGARDLYTHLAAGLALPADAFAARLQESFDAHRERHGGNPREISVAAVIADVMHSFGHDLAPDEIVAAERAFAGPELAGWRLLPGALDAVEELNAEGFRLAVASNAPSHVFVEEAVARLGLRPFFSPVMSPALAGARKPDPRLFLPIAAEWHLDPETVVVIGDGLAADIAGAHAAGMRGILIHGDANPENDRYTGADRPDATLTAIEDAPDLIAAWQRAAGDDARPETGFIEDF
jgi:HAD superfamily hydrolase (TIGR01509 family)